MKKTFLIPTLTLTTLLITGCAAAETRMEPIGLDSAKTIALEAAGLTASDVIFSKAVLDQRNDQDYYHVKFELDDREYDYDIDALTGKVLATRGTEDRDDDRDDVPDDIQDDRKDRDDKPAISTTPKPPVTTGQTNTDTSTELIGKEKALDLALAHAGLTRSDITFVKNGLDRDDGRQIYDVEFYSGNVEYDYDIDALTGSVLDHDFDAEYYDAPAADPDEPDDDRSTTTQPAGNTGSVKASELTEAEAKAIALALVPGATEKHIRDFEVDYDDGRLEFEGKICYDKMEYEFEIDGYSGAVRTWEVEALDDDDDDDDDRDD